jgi:hypothetical protein
MRSSSAISSDFHARYTTLRSPWVFSGEGHSTGAHGEENEVDWDEVGLLSLIERDGSIRAETLAPEVE